jgi:hypothetical protein
MLISFSAGLLAVWSIGMVTTHLNGGLIHLALFASVVGFFLRFLMVASGSFSR